MLQTSRCIALCALVFVSLDSLCSAGTEPLFYIYHGQPKALTLDSARIAVRLNPSVANPHASAVPSSLATRGFSDADVVAQPVPGWMILNAQNALTTSRTRGLLAPSAEDASSVHALITSLLNSGDSTIEFVSPVFRDEAGDPIILTPTLLIGFKENFSAAGQSQLLAAVPEGAEQQKVEFPQQYTQRWQLHSHDGFAALDRANTLARTPGVTYAELDMIVTGHADLVPTDPLFVQSWGLKNTGQSGGQVGFDMEATSAWDITTGSSSVIVLILDVGVQQNHPDINQVTGQDFTSDAPSNPNGGPFGVYDNHGTWVAGCVSGLINNGLGTAGIAPGVKVASARCYNNVQSNGTSTFQFSWVVDALNWGQSIGARVSNNSNHYDQPSSAIEDAYASTRANGMVHFASAGNDGTASISYPSSISSVNSVGAANRFGERSSFSQYGVGLKYLAPGEQIYTTDRTGSAGGVPGDYELVDGTSFASPYAAGIAALIISQTPGLSVDDVESQMQTSCRDMGPAGYDTDYGYGIVDAYVALMKITSNLNPPSGQIGISFSYQITASNNPTSYSATGLPSGLQLNTATGLINGIPTASGTFQVVVTAHGPGDATATVQIVIIGPTITSVLNPPNVQIGDQFNYQITASTDITSYNATNLPPGLEIDSLTGIISGVPNISGTYHITIIAHGSFGDATGVLTLVVVVPPIPPVYASPVATLPVGNGPMVTDPVQPRLYVASDHSIAVVDTAAFSVLETISISDNEFATDLSISPDGKTLWFTRTNDTIGRIDLETLAALPDLPTSELVLQVREGLAHQLYCASWTGGIVQLDSTTGAVQARFDTDPTPQGYPNYCSVEITPDRGTLFVGRSPAVPGIDKYDVSTPTATFLQTVAQAGDLGDITVSHNGELLCFWTSVVTNEFSTADITQPLGSLDYQSKNSDYAIFSQDDSLIFQLVASIGTFSNIAIFNSTTRQVVRAIALPPVTNGYGHLAVDQTNSYVMVCAGYGGQPNLSFYVIHPPTIVTPPHSLLNVSTRTFVQTGDNVEIGGFIIHGGQPKKVVLRAIGPSLAAYGLPAVTDPVLDLHDSTGAIVVTNDNWNSHRADVLATGLAPSDEHEAVIVTTLVPGNYTAVLKGLNGATGTALFELYDVDPTNSTIANISTRSNVQTGDNVMIGGFIIGGDQPTKVIVRAIGPSLTQFGVSGALLDPVLELHDGSGNLVTQNDDWRSDQEQAITDSGLAPSDDRESAILTTLAPGGYTAIVRGKNNTTGVALVEVYNLEAY